MEFDCIRLRFDTPLHLSNARPNDYGSSERVIHSDTFTAAVFQAWAMLGHADWIPADSNTSPGFTVSSLFPFRGGTQPIYFLPKPFFRHQTEPTNNADAGDAKKFKKVQFVDVPHFEAYLHQAPLPSLGTSAIRGAFQSQALASLKDDEADFLTSDVQTRLVKPRDESEPTPYYVERLYFRHDSGLWGLVRYETPEARQRVETAVRYLGDSGLGTDRAVGNGLFTPSFDKLNLNLPASGQFAVSLSLFCPTDHKQLTDVLSDSRTRYDLVRRGGWLSEPHNTYRKRSVWMLREGSLLHHANRRPDMLGTLVDLRPTLPNGLPSVNHPVWRDGRAFLLPVNL